MTHIRMATILLSLIGLSAMADNHSPQKNADASVTAQEDLSVTAQKKLTPEQTQKMHDNALRILGLVADARGNIHQKDFASAKTNLQRAQELVDETQAMEPTYRVRDRIDIAKKHLEYETAAEVSADLVPIYSELESATTYVPVDNARTHLDNAKRSLRDDDKVTAKQELSMAADAVAYSEIDLPLSKFENSIQDALTFLNKKNMTGADRALKTAESSLVMTGNEVVGIPATAKRSKIQKNHSGAKP